jgi:hypothetical protein
MWYVKGDLYRGDSCSLYTEKVENCSGYLIFSPDEVEMQLEETGTKFVCSYRNLNDKIRLNFILKFTGANPTSKEVKFYYLLKELESGKDFALIPISEKDYR